MTKETRRDFLKKSAAAGFFISASSIYGQSVKAGEQKVRVYKIGTHGMGGADISSLAGTGKVIFTHLCDVDQRRLDETLKQYPNVPSSMDYREIFAKHAKEFDAVCISTTDHTHAVMALEAMRLGKHVYVQKPLANNFEECDMLLAAAKKYKVVTQMGNQGHPGVYRYEKLWENKVWGDIIEVHSWTDRPIWAQGMKSLPPVHEVPKWLNWDCWLGPRAMRPYSNNYLPFSWRGWKDFGAGAIGDMAVHNFDAAYWLFADCQFPTHVKCWAPDKSDVAYPKLSTIDFRFGPTAKCPNGFKFYWYEGGLLPKPPPGSHPALSLPDNGLLINGTQGSTLGGSHTAAPRGIAVPGKVFGKPARDYQKLCKECFTSAKDSRPKWQYDHYGEWVDAVIENNPDKPGSKFEYAVPLTQTLILGCISQFFIGEELMWDAKKKEFNNPQATEMLKAMDREGFRLRV